MPSRIDELTSLHPPIHSLHPLRPSSALQLKFHKEITRQRRLDRGTHSVKGLIQAKNADCINKNAYAHYAIR